MTDFSKNPFFYLRRTNGKAFKISYDVDSIDYQNLLERMHCIGEKQFKIDQQNQILFLKGCPLNQDNLAQMILQINISNKAENNIVHLIDKYKVLQQKISFLLVQADLNKKNQMTYSAHDKVRKLIVDVLEGDQEYIEQFFVTYAGMILDPQKTFRQQYVENLSNLYFMDCSMYLKDKDLMKERLSTISVASNKDLKQSIFSFAKSVRNSNAINQSQKGLVKEQKKDGIVRSQNTANSAKSGERKDKNQLTSITTTAEKTCFLSRDQLIQDIAASNLENSNINAYLSSQKTFQKKICSQVDYKAESLSAIYSPNLQQQGQAYKQKIKGPDNILSNTQKINSRQDQKNKNEVDAKISKTDTGDIRDKLPDKQIIDRQITGKQIKQILNAKRKNQHTKTGPNILSDQFYNKFALNVNQALSLGKTGNSFACESQIVSYYQGEAEQIIQQSSIEEENIIGQAQFGYQHQPFTMIEDPAQQPISLETVNKSIRKRTGQTIVQTPLDQISQQSQQNQNSSIRSIQQSLHSNGKSSLSKKINSYQKDIKFEKQVSNQFLNSQNEKETNRDRRTSKQLPISDSEKANNSKQLSFVRNQQKKLVKRQSALKNEQDLAQLEQLQKKGNNFIMTNIQSTSSLNVQSKSDFDKYLEQVLQKNTSMNFNLNQNPSDKKIKVKPKKVLNLQSILQKSQQFDNQQLQNRSQKFDNQYRQKQVVTQNAQLRQSKSAKIEQQISKQSKSKDQIKIQIKQVVIDQKSPATLMTSQRQQRIMKSWDKSINIMQGQSIMLEDSSDQESMNQAQTLRQHPSLRKEQSIIIWKGDGNMSVQGDQSSSDQSNQEDLLAEFPQIKINKPSIKSLPDPNKLDGQFFNQKEQIADRPLFTSEYQKKIMVSWNKSISIAQGQSIMLPDSDQEQEQQIGIIGNRIKLSNNESIIIWKGDGNMSVQGNQSSSDQSNQQDLLADFPQIKINKPIIKSLPDPKKLDGQFFNQKEQTADRPLFTSEYQKKMMASWNKSINIAQGQSIMLPDSDQEQEQIGVIGNRIKLSNDTSVIIWKGSHEINPDQQSSSQEDQSFNQQNVVEVSSVKGSQGSKDQHSFELEDASFEAHNNKIHNIGSQGESSNESSKSIILWRTNKQKPKQVNQQETKVGQ